MASVKGPFRRRHATSASNHLEQREKVADSEKDKNKNKVDVESQELEETNAARRVPSRRRLSSGGLLRKSQKKQSKRPSLFRSYTSDGLFPWRRKKMASTGCDNDVPANGKSSAVELQRQDSRDRRHSTPITKSITPLQNDLVWKSEVNEDAEVFAGQVDAQLPPEKANTRTSVKSSGDNRDFSESSNVSGMKCDRDTRDRRAKSLPGPVNAGVHDLPFVTHSAAAVSEKPSEIQQASHEIFRRHTQYRNPIKRDKQIRRQSLPVLLNTATLREELENELKTPENFPKDHKLDSGTNLTEKVDTNSKTTLREDKKSPRTKGFKSSLLERFLEQKEVDEVDFNEQREGINQEKVHLYQKSVARCRRFSLPSRLEDFYGDDDKKDESSLNDELFSGTINNCQDLEADPGNVSLNKTGTTQQGFKNKKDGKARAKSLPHALTNFFSKIESGYGQKKPPPSNSDSPRRTKSLPKLTKLNNINMDGGYESKCDYTSAENSLNIEYSTQEVDGDTLEQFNQLGMLSATRSNFLPALDIDKSINTSTALTFDLDDEIQEVTKCVESVIQEFYKHKEQCGRANVRNSKDELRQMKTSKCANSLPLNTKDEVSTDTGNVEKGKQIGLGNLPTTVNDLEINSQMITHESVDKIVVTEIERSRKSPASQEEGSVSLEQTNNYICDCATKVNDSTPVELYESGDKSVKLLLSDYMTAEMEQEVHTEATEQRNEESSEAKPRAEATGCTTAFNAEFNLPKNKEETLMESGSILDIFEESEPVLQGVSPTFSLINGCSMQDQLSVENNRVKGMEDILSNEKSESENIISIRNEGADQKLTSEQMSAAAVRVDDENFLEEFPQLLEDEITSERAEVHKRAEEKSNYVETPGKILYDVIQSVLEELFCQVETLNNKTDAIRDSSSSVTVYKGLVESSLCEHELEKTIDENGDAQREFSSNAAKCQDDIFETSQSSGNIDDSEISSDHIIEFSPSDRDMIIPKQTEELQEKTSDLENNESGEKELSENNILLSFENDKEFDSESLVYPEGTESEEFENEVEEILEKVNDCNDVVDGETCENSAKMSPTMNEDNFSTLNENVRADIHLNIESDKGQGNDSICPVEIGETEKLFSQAEKSKIASDKLQPKQGVDDSFESCYTLAEQEQQPSEGFSHQQDHEILPANLLNITEELHKSVITESASDREMESLEITKDTQISSELKTAFIDNCADELQEPAVTEHFELNLEEKKNCERVDRESPAERSIETVTSESENSPNLEAMKLDKKQNIKTVKKDSSLSEKPTETSQEKLPNESAPSIEAIQLPKTILPCKEIETIPEALNAKPDNKKEEVVTMEKENKEQSGEHAEINEISKLSNNLQGESNGRKNLKLELKESNSEGVDICNHGSPIDKLSQELDAFDIPPFSRPRVFTLPFTHRMEKIVEAPCEISPEIESKEFPSVFPKGLPSDILRLRRTGSLYRDARKGKTEKTKRSFSAPSNMLHQKGGKHDLYPVQEEPEAPELTFDDRMELFGKILSNSLETILEPDFTRSKSPLHRAIAKKRFDCVEFLIECGVDINANDESGWPPLHVAVTSGCFDCAVLLVEAGADLGGYTDLVMHEYKRLRRQVYCRTL